MGHRKMLTMSRCWQKCILIMLVLCHGAERVMADNPSVPWLARVQQPPEMPAPFESGAMQPLLIGDDQQPIG